MSTLRAGGERPRVTYLELTDPEQLVPPSRPAPAGLAIGTVSDPRVNRRLYEIIGADFRWTDRLGWTAAEWEAHAAGAVTRVARIGGAEAGYAELRRSPGGVEVAILGLLAPARELGAGGHLLTDALRTGLTLAPRVWLHTCTDDDPRALPNYLARGLRISAVR